MSTNTTDTLNLSGLDLFDHHCHGVLKSDVNRENFEALISESSRPATTGTTRFDSQIGFQIRAHCAPILGLEQFCDPQTYIERRNELGVDEVNRRFLQAAEIRTYGIESGHAADLIYSPDEMAEAANARAHEIVRLERIAELVTQRIRTNRPTPADLLEAIENELDKRLEDAIGVKTIAAYRIGLDFEPTRPNHADVLNAAEQLLDTQGPVRLADPVFIRHLIWLAVDRSCVIQFHIGYGDDDVNLDRCNPLLLTELIRSTTDTGARITLLHCYPFHREAGYLADVFPHVYFDVGLAINYSGSRSNEVIAESLELAPFGKILFSSDAWGAPELFYLGVKLYLRGLSDALSTFRDRDHWPVEECVRVA
ncbi:MAG: amidohydrolase family protein, partial [Canibacter sp.]